MKPFLVSLSLSLSALSGLALADTAAPAPTASPVSIASAMDNMNSDLSKIMQQASNSADNQSSAALCQDLETQAAQARQGVPDAVASLPLDQQAAQLTAYQDMIDQLIVAVDKMKTDFLNNNNSVIAQDLKTIVGIKSAGHSQFNPQP